MTKLINCVAGEPLGYVSYFRATYEQGTLATDAVFQGYVRDLVARVQSSNEITLNGDPDVIDGDTAAVLDVRTYPRGAPLTVAQLLDRLDPTAILPDWLSGVSLASLEKITQQASNPQQRASAKDTREQQQEDDSVWEKLAGALADVKTILILALIVAALWLGLKAWRAVKV